MKEKLSENTLSHITRLLKLLELLL